MLTVRAVEQFLDKLNTLEIQKLRILFLAPVERHAHLPRTSEDLRVLDGRLIGDYIRTGALVAFHYVQFIAMEVSRAVEPGLIVQVGYVDHESIALPAPDRLAHPGIGGRGSRIFEIYVADRPRVLIDERERAGALHYLERIGHIGGARHTGEIALDLGIAVQPILLVLLSGFERFGLVGDFAAFHYAETGRHSAHSA